MKQTVPSIVVLLIAIVVAIVITPVYYIGIIQWRNDQEICIVEARNLADKIIDTRQYTTEMESDFNLALATMHGTYTGEVKREIMMVNPDPNYDSSDPEASKTYTSYVVTDDLSHWNQGDYVTVTIKPVGHSLLQSISMRLLGAYYDTDPISFKGRVR